MVHPARMFVLSVSTSSAIALLGGSASAQVQQPASAGDRVLGFDVSAWQGDITAAEWATFKRPTNQQVNGVSGDGRDFVFIRSSRGGTTGYYDQTNADNVPATNTLSQRYDDPYYIRNITRATGAGLLAGTYHFSRPDVVESTTNSNGIANTGADEADHFIQMAGPWMRPGYLMPVHDFEAGDGARTDAQLTQFVLDFSNRMYQVMGIRPSIYVNGNYANILANSGALVSQVVPAHSNLWAARWPNQDNPNSINVQTGHPKDSYAPIYGPWDDAPGATHPWSFWQYASTARLNGNNAGGSSTDVNVAQGNIEFVKDHLVPAVWMQSTGGNWHDLANWNSGQTPVAPVQGPGQVARIGAMTLPGARLPGRPDPNNATNATNVTGLDDTVNLNRPNENIAVTLSQGAYNLRRLNLYETLNVTGGSLDARLTGQVTTGGTLSLSGGAVTFNEGYLNSTGVLEFTGNGTLNVGSLFVANNGVSVPATSTGTGVIQAKAGAANPKLDLTGATRTFNVNDGSASTDLRVALPLTNGSLTKTGGGTLELTGNNSAFAGNLFISGGNLRMTNANQIGTAGVRVSSSGAVRLDGNGLNVTRPIDLAGRGFGNGGGLVNVSGDNTWSGNVVLTGANHHQNEAGLNQVNAATGTTLRLTGVIQDNAAGVLRSIAKLGGGDLVLGGASPNTHTNLTRVFDGRLIIEKDGALGATNQTIADANTIQLTNANSAVAFRAPTGSFGLNYTAQEWIFTEGNGVNGAQLDNLGGANTFAGHVGLGGPVVSGTRQQAYLGVSAGSLELSGGLHARGTLNSTGPEARDVFKRGAGTLTLSGTNAGGPSNAFARELAAGSTFTVEAGTVRLKGTAGNGANVAGVDTWKVNGGATLALSQGGAAGNAAVEFHGGTLRAEQSMTAANALNFAGDGTLDTGAPAASMSARFTGAVTGNGNLTKSGTEHVSLAGAVNGFRGAVNVAGGTLGVAANGTDAAVANVNGVSVAPAARLDLADNDLIVRTTPAGAVEQLVATGYNGGAWDGAGGIVSTTAADNDWIYTLGVADNARLGRSAFGGHTGLVGAEAFVMYTIVGDADLSGVVNAADFARFRSGFANEMPDAWLFGDFDYSGVVDGADFELYMKGFLNQPGSTLTPSFADELTTFAVENGFDPTMVPEPAGLTLLALGTGLMLRRRRRN